MSESGTSGFRWSAQRRALLAKMREQHPATSTVSVTEAPDIDEASIEKNGDNGASRSCFPLSFAQQRMWVLDQLVPGNPFYNINSVVPIKSGLSLPGLRWSLNQLVKRHESLRTSFRLVDDQPMQVITPELEIDLPVMDLQGMMPAQREAEATRLAEAEGRHSFDLTQAPLFRMVLLRLGPEDHLFLLTMHHIICDGWSTEVFSRELSECYTSYLSGRAPQLADLTIQYADYAVWQRNWLTGETLEKQLSYWRDQLAGVPQFDLPADHRRPPELSYRGANFDLSFPRPVSSALKSLSQEEGVTLFMTLLAIFKVLLYRYTRQSDIAVGCPVAGRTRTELESLVGFFVNTLVLRTQISDDLSFRTYLRNVRETTLSAFAHQDLPFETLVERLQPDRDLSRNPLFQVMFQLFSPMQGNSASGTSASSSTPPPQIGRGTAIFDLALHLSEGPHGLWGIFEYSTDLFERETIERMSGHLRTLMQSVVIDPDAAIGKLTLLDDNERSQLLSWNEKGNLDAERPTVSLAEMIEASLSQNSNETAVIDHGVPLTYKALDKLASQLAMQLAAMTQGEKEVRVVVCLPRSWYTLVALLACTRAGVVYIPLDPGYPPERLAAIIDDAEPTIAISVKRFEPLFQDIEQILYLDDLMPTPDNLEGFSNDDEPRQIESLHPESLLYLIYTSGSTGTPKGIAMPHRGFAHLIDWQIQRSGFAHAAVVLQFAPVGFDVSPQEFLSTLCSGGTLIITNEEERRDPFVLWEMILDHRVQRLFIPPAALQQLAVAAQQVDVEGSELKEIITAGEQLQITEPTLELLERLPDCRIDNQYGPAETHVATAKPLDPSDGALPASPPIGCPLTHSAAYVLDAFGEPVPIGVIGELFVGGDGLARGYWNQPALTAERFVPDPFSKVPGARLYQTGDLARYRSSGEIEFCGRCDHQVKIRGYRIELAEIEASLSQHPSVNDSVVLARGTNAMDRHLIAYFVPDSKASAQKNGDRDGASLIEDIRHFLSGRLPAFMVPSFLFPLPSLPRSRNGKVDRKALPEMEAGESQSSHSKVAPRNELEEAIAGIWSSVLNDSEVGVHDHFFSQLGGHSLLATQVVAKLRSVLRVEVPLSQLFRAPTVAELATYVETLLQSELSSAPK